MSDGFFFSICSDTWKTFLFLVVPLFLFPLFAIVPNGTCSLLFRSVVPLFNSISISITLFSVVPIDYFPLFLLDINLLLVVPISWSLVLLWYFFFCVLFFYFILFLYKISLFLNVLISCLFVSHCTNRHDLASCCSNQLLVSFPIFQLDISLFPVVPINYFPLFRLDISLFLDFPISRLLVLFYSDKILPFFMLPICFVLIRWFFLPHFCLFRSWFACYTVFQ